MKRIVLTFIIMIFAWADFPAQSNDLPNSSRRTKNKTAKVSRKPITDKVYNDRMLQASIVTRKKPLRTVSVQTIYKDGKVIKTIRTVDERDISDRQRMHTIEITGKTKHAI